MFGRLTDRLCNIYSMPADELAALMGNEPVRQTTEVVHRHEVHIVHHHVVEAAPAQPALERPAPIVLTETGGVFQ